MPQKGIPDPARMRGTDARPRDTASGHQVMEGSKIRRKPRNFMNIPILTSGLQGAPEMTFHRFPILQRRHGRCGPANQNGEGRVFAALLDAIEFSRAILVYGAATRPCGLDQAPDAMPPGIRKRTP